MVEVTIKAHTRRGKGGKTVQVRGYRRRVGKKGVHSPKREKTEQSGEEYERMVSEKKPVRKITPEEIAERKEAMEGFKRADAERKSLGMSMDEYSRYKLGQRSKDKKEPQSDTRLRTPLTPQGSLGILEKVEDKVARFVEKYSKRKYKRQL